MCLDAGQEEETPQRLQLPTSTTIAMLKLICFHIFAVDASLQQLTLHSGPRAGEDLGSDNSLDLGYWNLTNGEVISVAELDSERVWAHFSATEKEVVPEHWILPPEMRPELDGIGE